MNPNARSADWHLSFFLEHDTHHDDVIAKSWGDKIGDSYVTAVGYYVSNMRIQTGHALVQLSREVTRSEIEDYLADKRMGSYCLFPVRGHVMPQFLVDKLHQTYGTFATFSVKELLHA